MRALLDPLNLLIACCALAAVAVLVTGAGALLEAWRARHEARAHRSAPGATDDGVVAQAGSTEPEEADETGPWHRPRPFVRHEPTGEAPTDLVRLTAAPLAEVAEAEADEAEADEAAAAHAALLAAAPAPHGAVGGGDVPPDPTPGPTRRSPDPADVERVRPAQPSHVRLVPADAPTTPRRPLDEAAPAADAPAAEVAATGLRIDAPTAAQLVGGSPVIDLAEARARRTGQHPAVVVDDDAVAPSAARHPSGGTERAPEPAARRKLPRGAEAALQSILEIRPDPRNTLAIQRDPTAEVRLTDADRAAAARRHGRPA